MKNVHKLTEGAILLAGFAVLTLITSYVPILASILIFVLPLPFIMFSAKNNLKYILAFFLAAVFISFFSGSLKGLALMLIFGTTGVVIGFLLQKNKSRTAILISSSLTLMAGLVIFYVAIVAILKIDIIHELSAALNESVKNSQDMLKSMGREDQIKRLKEQNANLLNMLKTLVPYFLIMVAIVYAFIIQWVCFPIAKRLGLKVQTWGSFRNLFLPKSLLWYYLIAIGGIILFHPDEGTYLYTVLINAKYILEMFLLLQGLAFLFFIFHQRSVPKGLGVLVVILSFMIPIVHYIIMILGIADLGFNFRQRFGKKE